MPGGFPLGLDICNGTSLGADTANSQGTGFTLVSNNTKTAWVQLTASLASDCVFIVVACHNFCDAAAAGCSASFDIGVGAAGSEKVVIADLVLGAGNVAGGADAGAYYAMPIAIPSGTRVAARCQVSNTAIAFPFLSTVFFDGAFTQIEGYAGVDALGFNAAATTGTAVTSGNPVNTLGAYAQIVASTSVDYAGLLFGFDNDATGTIVSGPGMLFNVAIGAAGSEQIIIPNYEMWIDAQYRFFALASPFFPIAIPAGTRIAVKSQSNNTASVVAGITLYGVYQ